MKTFVTAPLFILERILDFLIRLFKPKRELLIDIYRKEVGRQIVVQSFSTKEQADIYHRGTASDDFKRVARRRIRYYEGQFDE